MALGGYQFTREIKRFNTDSCIAHLGWVATSITRLKIYSKFDSPFFYLHDEVEDRLFEFLADDPGNLKSKEEYDEVIAAFLIYQNDLS